MRGEDKNMCRYIIDMFVYFLFTVLYLQEAIPEDS